MNYSQALDRIGAAKDIDIVFKKHPKLESGSQRLKITRTEGYDHVRRDMWVGDVVTAHCDLPSSWKEGREQAVAFLVETRIPGDSFAFQDFFSQAGCNLMCPWGGNKYLGVSSTTDVQEVGLRVEEASMPFSVEEVTLEDNVLSLEEALMHDLTSGNPTVDVSPHSNAPSLASGPGINPKDFLLVNGKYVHKETICHRVVLNKDFIPKSLNRQERVCSTGFTKPTDDVIS